MIGVFNLESSYSLLHNTIPLETLVKEAKNNGYDFVSLVDFKLHGMINLANLSKEYKIKALLGYQVRITIDVSSSLFYIIIKNNEGYQNLISLVNLSIDKEINLETLSEYSKGLIFITGGKNSIIDTLIGNDQISLAETYLTIFKEKLNELYLGISLDTFDEEFKVAPKLVKVAKKFNLKYLPLHQTSYLNEENKKVYEAVRKIDDNNFKIKEEDNFALLTRNEIIKRFSDYKEVFIYSEEVIKSIDFEFQFPTFNLPKYPLKDTVKQSDYLKSLSILGLKKRLANYHNPNHKIYQERLLYELDVINKMGYDDYFLIVYDFVKFAKDNDILVGPGRGSAAGSLVSYCLGITDVDPIKYELLFERFLNPNRQSMPDIDLDFPDNRRDEVIHYVKEKYGISHIASIVTFGKFALKSSIRDIARVMQIDQNRVSGIITRVVNNKVDYNDEEAARLINVASKIEGLIRHTGTHAAGIILSDQDLTKTIPLQNGAFSFYQTQLEASDLAKLGLLKIDFLGIRNLAVIDEVVKQIRKKEPSFDLKNIPLDDQKTFKLLQEAKTSGVFQLESSGMKSVLRKLKPVDFEDIVAILALYRPGPMDNIDLYIERRNKKSFSYLDKDLEPILRKTYGIIIYQEQIMAIASQFAGYTLAEADILRRGVSKKDKEILDNERIVFVSKCQKQGRSKELAEKIYDLIVRFADYGFNRSHSVAYGIVAYQMAYLKANYFSYFISTLLSSVIGNEQLTKDYLDEAKKNNLVILPPDINESSNLYLAINNEIRLPLLLVKSIGENTLKAIFEKRDEQKFKDYLDLKLRLRNDVNERQLVMLIKSGALDCFNLTKSTMINYSKMENVGFEQYVKDFKLEVLKEEDFNTLAIYEKEALGFNVTYNLLSLFADFIKENKLDTLFSLETKNDVDVIANVKKIKKIKTKTGLPMAFITLDDGNSEIEATIFTTVFNKYYDLINEDIYQFKITKNYYNEKVSYQINEIKEIKK